MIEVYLEADNLAAARDWIGKDPCGLPARRPAGAGPVVGADRASSQPRPQRARDRIRAARPARERVDRLMSSTSNRKVKFMCCLPAFNYSNTTVGGGIRNPHRDDRWA